MDQEIALPPRLTKGCRCRAAASTRITSDGRYIREEVRGSYAGKPHEKLTLLGFNNVRQRYEYMTADNNDAVILLYVSQPNAALGSGSCIEAFADYVYAGDGPDVAGTLVTVRTVIEIESADLHVLRNFYGAPGREEYLFLEYRYERTGP
jgi:hypothetical protein